LATGALLLSGVLPGGTVPREAAAAVPKGGARHAGPEALGDDVIVAVLVQTQDIVRQTAALGTWKPPKGSLRHVSTRVHTDVDKMLKRLEAYASKRGYAVETIDAAPAAKQGAASASAFGELIGALRALDASEFAPIYLTVLRDFLGEMVAITRGAQDVAGDPTLKAMLVQMEKSLSFDHDLVDGLLLTYPAPATPGEGGQLPDRLPVH
jgi:hypothetical protein